MEIQKEKIKKILLVNLAFIGDVVLATPVTRALKNAYPDAEISMMTIPAAANVAEMNPYVNRVLLYDKKGEHKGLTGAIEIVAALRKEKFDMAVCMNFALRGALIAWAAGIPYRVGYDAQHANWFLTHVTSAVRERIQHETINHLNVLRSIDIGTQDTSLAFKIDSGIEEIVKTTFHRDSSQPLVVVCPFGSYPKKNFCAEMYASIIGKLKERADIILIGGQKEQESLNEIASLVGMPESHVYAGKLNLKELAVLLKESDVLLTVDTGPLHIAQAVQTPVVALFGPTDPMVWGPRGNRDTVVYLKKSCSPCWGRGDCTSNFCMEEMDVDTIVAKVLHTIGAPIEVTS